MSAWVLAAGSVIYLVAGFDLLLHGRPGLGACLVLYAAANAALIWDILNLSNRLP